MGGRCSSTFTLVKLKDVKQSFDIKKKTTKTNRKAYHVITQQYIAFETHFAVLKHTKYQNIKSTKVYIRILSCAAKSSELYTKKKLHSFETI